MANRHDSRQRLSIAIKIRRRSPHDFERKIEFVDHIAGNGREVFAKRGPEKLAALLWSGARGEDVWQDEFQFTNFRDYFIHIAAKEVRDFLDAYTPGKHVAQIGNTKITPVGAGI